MGLNVIRWNWMVLDKIIWDQIRSNLIPYMGLDEGLVGFRCVQMGLDEGFDKY